MSEKYVDPELRAKIRAQLLADYGESTMLPGNRMPPVQRLPSRSPAMDYIMGGGYPFGMITRKWGSYSTGKTTTTFNAFWAAQNFGELRHGRLSYLAELSLKAGDTREAKKLADQAKREREKSLKCFYVCTEQVFDEKLARDLGLRLDEDSFELVFSRRIEEIGDIVQKALLGYHVVAVDSTTGTISLDELGHKDGIYGDSQTTGMTRAKKWGVNLDWWQDRISRDNVLILTGQISSSIGMTVQQRFAAEKPPGGNKLNHEPAVILHFMRGGWLKRKKGGGLEPVGEKGGAIGAFGKAQAAGSELVIRCDKNKTGVSHRVALLHHDKREANFDVLHEYEKLAKYFKVVKPTTANSSWYVLPDGVTKTQSLRETIEESPELIREIEDATLRCAADPRYEDQLLRSGGVSETLGPELEAVA